MSGNNGRLDRLRQGQGEVPNHVIDEFAAGRISRRDFLRRGSVVGISVPVLAAVVGACESSSSPSPRRSSGPVAHRTGATITAGILTPTGAINPLTVADVGGGVMLAQTGEYLCLADQQLALRPVLAESWTPNSAADVWTFKIRPGVTFHDGRPLTADDVVYTYKLQTNPKNSANALSAFGGVLGPSGVTKVDDHTVAFHLEGPNGNFPYLTSSENYNMIILPDGYDPADWQTSFVGTGPFVLTSYTPGAGASFTRNSQYWGPKALPAATEFTFYDTQAPQILALSSGTVDVIGQFSVPGAEQLLAPGASYNIIRLRSSAHHELSMRCDTAPFTDRRVRQAIALTLDRPAIVRALFKGYADVGDDTPFAPVFASTDTSIPQRGKDISTARALMSAAGYPSGLTVRLTTLQFQEVPQYAQIVAQAATSIGVTIRLTVESPAVYYGKATFGNSDWLDATMSLVNYAHRSVPNVFLSAPLHTTNAATGTGSWNAAHFNDTQYDTLSRQYIAAVDLNTQRTIAGQIQTLLLDQTPIIYAYFFDHLTATAANVTGVYPTAMGALFLNNAVKT
ncbi:MAG TPA: ABC transporter substrate-binding protein [Streptosporangiaceae bacterium]|nr:ABC transporter substrate-binding protein [Streptosporangiaceae bacterium]